MTTKTVKHDELAADIERLVREYISTIRSSAEAAVERAVGAGSRSGPAKQPVAASATRARAGTRRPSSELEALSERLYEVLCRTPGETMAVLAPLVGAKPRELSRPVFLLKRDGRIRSVGTKHATRYFPMAREAQPSSA